jgi:hypothetical protein
MGRHSKAVKMETGKAKRSGTLQGLCFWLIRLSCSLLNNITIIRHLPERAKHYFVIICTLVRAVTIYLQGAAFAVVIS